MARKILNFVVMGASRVGKTSMISQLVENRLPAFYQSAPKAVSRKVIVDDEHEYECLLTDTASHDTYSPLLPQFVIGTHAFILVYSVTSRESFELVTIMHDKIVQFLYGITVSMVIVGNMTDRVAERIVSPAEGSELSRRLGYPHVESTSHCYEDMHSLLKLCVSTTQRTPRKLALRSTATSWGYSDIFNWISASTQVHKVQDTVPQTSEPRSFDHHTEIGPVGQLSRRISHGVQSLILSSSVSNDSPIVAAESSQRSLTEGTSSRYAPTLHDCLTVDGGDHSARSSLPSLRRVWSQHQMAERPTRQQAFSEHPASRTLPEHTLIRREDLIDNPQRFFESLNSHGAVGRGNTGSHMHSTLGDAFLSILGDRVATKSLLQLRGDDAQLVLDRMQTVLDSETMCLTRADRARLLHLLLQFSKLSSRYPGSLILPRISRTDEHAVAAGHFGEIWKGRLGHHPVCLKVVKVYQRSDVDKLVNIFAREAIVWSQLKHENVLPFYGIHRLDDEARRICLVSPWMDNGCVGDYLRRHPTQNRYSLAQDVSKGLLYLHNSGIVHGDLKGVNVLVTGGGRACVADFGLSAVAESEITRWTSLVSTAGVGGTVRWQAPELFDPAHEEARPTKLSDVYSLGCVFYEIFTSNIPFHEVSRESTVISYVQFGRKPTRPDEGSPPFQQWGLCDELWESCIEPCWSRICEERPTIPFVMLKLNDIEQTFGVSGVALPENTSHRTARTDDWLTPAEIRRLQGLPSQGSWKIPINTLRRDSSSIVGSDDASWGSSWFQWFRSPDS